MGLDINFSGNLTCFTGSRMFKFSTVFFSFGFFANKAFHREINGQDKCSENYEIHNSQVRWLKYTTRSDKTSDEY